MMRPGNTLTESQRGMRRTLPGRVGCGIIAKGQEMPAAKNG